MTTILVPGRRPAGAETARPEDADWTQAPLDTVQVSSARGAESGQAEVTVPEAHVVEVELENGVVLYRTAEELQPQGTSRSAGTPDGVLELPRRLDFGLPGRSATGFLVRAYRFFGGKIVSAAVEETAKRIDGFDPKKPRTDPSRLVHCVTPHLTTPVKPGAVKDGTKMLVLLHGTFSSTEGSFGDLSPPETNALALLGDAPAPGQPPWQILQSAFRDPDDEGVFHIYGFEHATLTKSPIENAIALLEALPRDAEVHLLTHSRGGLIGELLARGGLVGSRSPIDQDDRRFFETLRRDSRQRDRELAQLAELNDLLEQKRPVVKHMVRTACPTQGTILASKRLDLYLSAILNLIRLIPGPHSAVVAELRRLVMQIVATKSKADVLPGLEAMMPTAPLVAMLNRPEPKLPGDLTVFAGDVEPSGLLRGLAIIASDLFFLEDHDIVVNTAAMLGGTPRTGRTRDHLSRGPEITHFSYFRNASIALKMARALRGDDLPDLVARTPAAPALAGTRGGDEIDGTKPVVVVLPGTMGSRLRQDDRLTWMHLGRLAFGGIRDIGVDKATGKPAGGVEVDGPMDKYYGDLIRRLGRKGNHVEVFDYDWRLSVTDEAERLHDRIDRILDRTAAGGQPVRILAHSMGGLVARAMIAGHRGTWERMLDRKGARLVMLGTPNGGSISMAAGLLGHDKMIRTLELIDVTSDMGQITSAITGLPGVVELLPTDDGFRYFDAAHWKALGAAAGVAGWTAPPKAVLAAAKKTYEALDLRDEDAQHMAYVAGKAAATPVSIELDPFRVMATAQGDGRVTWRTGTLPGVDTWYAPTTVHGDLARDPRLFSAIEDLLDRGSTARLSQKPPVSRAFERLFPLPDAAPLLYPTPDDVDLLVMGGTPEQRLVSTAEHDRCRVTIKHGDLRLQPGTIAVGHYRDAPLMSAECALDVVLDERLSRHRVLDIYPGALKTAELFRGAATGVGPDGALVIGLGQFGELGRAKLEATLTQGFLRYAMRIHDEHLSDHGLSSLLIGHRDSLLTVRDCVQALLEAIRHTNTRLPRGQGISDLTILELYEDTAVEAAEVLRDLATEARYQDTLDIHPMLHPGAAGRQRYRYGGEVEWEQKVRITGQDQDGSLPPGYLNFESLNKGALVSQQRTRVAFGPVDRQIAKVTESEYSDSTTGKLLFQWLVPAAMRPMMSDGRNITLIVDETSAGYPWELMEDRALYTRDPTSPGRILRGAHRPRPISVAGNMIRQYRDNPRDDRPPNASTEQVLVIGDPVSDFAALHAADKEAQGVAEKFRRTGWRTVDEFRKTEWFGRTAGDTRGPSSLEEALFLNEYRVFHFAGHGVNDGPGKTGLVLGKDTLLSPDLVDKFPCAPEFVFLNCCHVGFVGGRPGEALSKPAGPMPEMQGAERVRLAANLAIEFMRWGSRAVIAAGWAIADDAAETFAQTFYDRFLDGTDFGQSVRIARDACWQNHEHVNTWGAFQCYGDPQFRIIRDPSVRRSPGADRRFSAVTQATVAMRTLQAQANFVRSEDEAKGLSDDFAKTLSEIGDSFDVFEDPQLLEAIGRAAADIGNIPVAIDYLERASKTSPAAFSVEAMEQLLELRVREATRDRLAGKTDAKAETTAIQAMRDHLDMHNNFSGGEGVVTRWIRIGDTELRKAAAYSDRANTATVSETVQGVLKKAIAAYVQAGAMSRSTETLEIAHPRIRQAAAEYFLRLEQGKPLRPETVSLVTSIVAGLTDSAPEILTFEQARLMAEARLFLFLTEPDASLDFRNEVIEDFNRAFLCGASLRKSGETVDDLHVVARLLRRKNLPASEAVAGIAQDLRRRVPQGRA